MYVENKGEGKLILFENFVIFLLFFENFEDIWGFFKFRKRFLESLEEKRVKINDFVFFFWLILVLKGENNLFYL